MHTYPRFCIYAEQEEKNIYDDWLNKVSIHFFPW